ncbi:MAG: DUF4127 family protein [Armatimonadetes bacterium]|nr:DUF4127 family protein [Armatimonadota bacterium]
MTLRHRVHKVIYVPLDDRACNVKHVRFLAQMVDYDLAVPPLELLGGFTTPGQPEALWEWLLSEVKAGADAAVISLDMLVYGGLVASRSPQTRAQLALQRLDLLSELRRLAPELPVLASNVVMRLATTSPGDQATASLALLRRYSELSGLVEELGKATHRRELEKVRRRLPADLLGQYLACRERNHQVNLRALAETAAGNLDYLALVQEDAGPYGPHTSEQRAILRVVEEQRLGEKVSLHPGVDQVGAQLFARFVHQHMEKVPRVFVLPSNAGHLKNIPPLEDRPFADTLAAKVKLIGGEQASGPDFADLVLAVNAPLRRDRAYYGAAPNRAARAQRMAQFARGISELGHPGTAVCDAAYPDGADEAFVSALFAEGIWPLGLLSFAACGTAGDSAAAALAQGTLRLIALQDKGAFDLANVVVSLTPLRYLELLNSLIDSEKAHVSLLFHRLVDDWLYQARVRPGVIQGLVDMIRTSRADLTAIFPHTESLVREELTRAAADLWIERFLGRPSVSIGPSNARSWLMLAELEETRVRLPWRRLLETDLDFEFGVQLVAAGEDSRSASR